MQGERGMSGLPGQAGEVLQGQQVRQPVTSGPKMRAVRAENERPTANAGMTREQILDQAVKLAFTPPIARRVLEAANRCEKIRLKGPKDGAHPGWFVGSVAEVALSDFPGPVERTRKHFARLLKAANDLPRME